MLLVEDRDRAPRLFPLVLNTRLLELVVWVKADALVDIDWGRDWDFSGTTPDVVTDNTTVPVQYRSVGLHLDGCGKGSVCVAVAAHSPQYWSGAPGRRGKPFRWFTD